MTDETPQDRGMAASRQDRAATAKAGKGAPPPADVRAITAQLEHDRSCRVLRTLNGSGSPGGSPGVAVIETTPEHAAMLAAYPGIQIEPDHTAGLRVPAHAVLPPVVTQQITFEVLDDGMRPIEGAAVAVTGSGLPATGFTGPDGRAERPPT